MAFSSEAPARQDLAHQAPCTLRQPEAANRQPVWRVFGTWPGFLRDGMSCWEQALCLSFLSLPFQAAPLLALLSSLPRLPPPGQSLDPALPGAQGSL